MGISYLTSLVETYAKREIINGQHVVIDGPALAYYVWERCLKQNGIQPTYEHLRAYVQKLMSIFKANEVTIDAVYFDGYLPDKKRTTRLSRLKRDTSKVAHLYVRNRYGLPLNWFLAENLSDSNPCQNENVALLDSASSILAPAFLVPSVFALLRESGISDVLHLVPGEADEFCASHMALEEIGGLILTSDSDLLLYNIGKGRVVFFKDIEQNLALSDSQDCRSLPIILKALVFDAKEISKKLTSQNKGDMLRLGFECSRHTSRKPKDILHRSRLPLPKECLPRFEEFSQRYRHTEIGALKQPSLNFDNSNIHARLSELALQIHLKKPSVDIFLPLLIEPPHTRSAWDHCTFIRQLAYSIASLVSGHSHQQIHEFRRLQTLEQKGRVVQFMSESATLSAANDMLSALPKARITRLSQENPTLRWFILFVTISAYKDTSHQLWQDTLMRRPTNLSLGGASRTYISWDVVHFFSQVCAVMYSLHMLFGVLSCHAASELVAEHSILAEMRRFLYPIPDLRDWPEIGLTHQILDDKGRRKLQNLVFQLEITQLPGYHNVEQVSRELSPSDSNNYR